MAQRGSTPTVLWLLIAISLILYMVTLIESDLVLTLGLRPASFLDRPWTIVTNLFIHGGIWHILANMITLYFLGSYTSRLLGTTKFLIVYFGGGILGNIFYLLLALYTPLASSYSIAVGASGAIFALGGVLTAMRPKLRVFVFPIPVPLPIWAAIIGIFIIISLFPNVAWQAHLGGLVFGLIAGFFFRRRQRYYYT